MKLCWLLVLSSGLARAEPLLVGKEFFDPITQAKVEIGPVNDETVLGFELLYATPGVNDISEVAGHLLLRIKLKNNPLAAMMGVENPNDIVVSFLADTADLWRRPEKTELPEASCAEEESLFFAGSDRREFHPVKSVTQAVKGLLGGFSTNYDRTTLFHTLASYTYFQNRTLLRYELTLTPEQKRNLIRHLKEMLTAEKPNYRFFDQNCASILVQVIGQGIKDAGVANFHKVVMPPNALVALLVRRGLAKQVFPSFYGIELKGYLAQDLIVQKMASLNERYNEKYSDSDLPPVSAIFAEDVKSRVAFLERLAAFSDLHPDSVPIIFQIATLFPFVEYLHLDIKSRCQKYLTEALVTARKLSGDATTDKSFDPERAIDHMYRDSLLKEADTGSPHTRLLSLEFAASRQVSGRTQSSMTLGLALHKQEMGSVSRFSMQRAASVVLGQFSLGITKERHLLKASHYSLVGLDLRKFRERVDETPSLTSGLKAVGFGLGVLTVERDFSRQFRQTEYGNVKGLFNVVSNPQYTRHLHLYGGLSVDQIGLGEFDQQLDLMGGLTLGGSFLYTFDHQRTTVLRGRVQRKILAHGNRQIIRDDWQGRLSTLALKTGYYEGRVFLGQKAMKVRDTGDERQIYRNEWQLGMSFDRF
jgi:hypothetical protein